MGFSSRRSRGFSHYRREHKFRKAASRFVLFLLLLYLAFQAVSIILVTPFRMSGLSMEPAIVQGSRLAAFPVIYGINIPFTEASIPGFRAPRRGDIVLCTPPGSGAAPWYIRAADSVTGFFTLGRVRVGRASGQPGAPDKTIKRVIGIPGDTLRMEDHLVSIRPEGKQAFFSEYEIIQKPYTIKTDPLPEGWLPEFPFSGTSPGEITLGQEEYFLLGDYRSASRDSALWGPVTRDHIRSRVMLSYMPGFTFH